MKPNLIAALLCAAAATSFATAEESAREAKARPPVFVPFDFYPRHREELALSEGQAQEMQRLAEEMRSAAQKLEGERGEHTKALQELMAQDHVDADKAMEQFKPLLQTENEMKALQFRNGIAMRNLLTPEQLARLQPLAMKERGPGGGNPAEEKLKERLQQLREELKKRTNGEVPREVVEKIEQIEQTAREGRASEAKTQLEAVLRHFKSEGGADGQRPGNPPSREDQVRSIKQKLEHTDDPAARERLQEMLKRLSEDSAKTEPAQK